MEKTFLLTLLFAATATLAQIEPSGNPGRLSLPVNRRADGPILTTKDRNFLDNYDYDPIEETGFDQVPRIGGGSPPQRNRGNSNVPRPNLIPTNSDCRAKSRTLPHEKYCDLYYQTTGCENGQSLLRSCPNGLLYTGSGRHGLIGVCDYPHNVNCNKENHTVVTGQKVIEQQDPCQAKSKVVGDVTYCDRYWECFQNVPELYDCPNGLVWVGKNRGIADGCDYPWRNPSLCLNKDLANPPISTDHCDWLYGIFGHETSCTRYWTCWNGTATEQFCVGGLLYNEDTHACDWPQNVQGCQKHPLCKDDANGNVPLGKSCNRYWACQGGYPRLQRCPAMLVFDKKRKRCVSPPTEDCDVPPTTNPPDEDDNNNNKREISAENRRRLQQQGGLQPQGLQPQGLPFQLPEGATPLLNRPNN